MPDEQIAENMMAIYTNVLHKLPQETFNIKSILLKFTMSAPVKITEKGIEAPKIEAPAEEKKEAPVKAEKPKKKAAKEGEA
jgi:hypothetical protein